MLFFCFFKQKTAYEMRISDWSSDVCSSDLLAEPEQFDLDRGLWIIPPQVVKQLQDEMRKAGKRPQDVPPYIVPLSLQAIEIVRYLLGVMRPAQKYLLSHRSALKKRISENTPNKAVQPLGYEGHMTGHGIRGTIPTAPQTTDERRVG